MLGSLNLAEFVTDGKFDIAQFRKAVRIAVKGLNEVLDEGMPLHPLKEQRESVKDWRQIGLGIFGLADMLIKLKIKYGSEISIALCDKIGNVMATEAILASQELAQKDGPFPMFDDCIFDSDFYNEHMSAEYTLPLRNSQLLTIAPTGSLSTMLSVSGGIEPVYANYYTRKTESLHGEDRYYKIYTPIVEQYIEEHELKDDSELPDYFVASADIPFKQRIEMQSVWQKHIDASISSTVNLPKSATKKDVRELYLYAWQKGLKGITVFRDGCERAGILTTEDNPDGEKSLRSRTPSDLPRGYVLDAADEGIGLNTVIHSGCGKFYLNVKFDSNDGQPYEIFINKGSQGSCRCNLEGITRMTSYALRGGCCIEGVIDQLKSVDACPAYRVATVQGKGTSPGSCCPAAIGLALERLCKQYKEMFGYEDDEEIIELSQKEEITTGLECPECGEQLSMEGGCNICHNCGWSKCD